MKARVFWFLWLCPLLAFDRHSRHVDFSIPKGWPEPVYRFDQNPLTEDGIALGRALFYDPVLSADSSISCMSCHLSYTAFAHTDHALSHGIGDRIGKRNAPALQNLAWGSRFMWDGAVHHLDFLALAPISHPDEMGETMDHVLVKLGRNPVYRKRFKAAFGVETPTGERTLKAISQFLLTLVSKNSRFDSMQRGQVVFSESERKGYALFQTHCSSCHTEPLFSNQGFEKNGLAPDPLHPDIGRAAITHLSEDSFRFNVPSLRNIRYSAPYMHDGRFRRLRDAIRQYEGKQLPGGKGTTKRQPIHLSPENESDLLAFLFTLSDPDFLFNPRFGPPRGESPR